jgi:hypothetical protein
MATTALIPASIGIVCLLILIYFGRLLGPPGNAHYLLFSLVLLSVVAIILTGAAYVQAGVRVLPWWGNIALIILIIGAILHPYVWIGREPNAINAITVAATFAFGCLWLALAYVLWSRQSATAPSR